MTLDAARSMLPIARRLDWRSGRLSWIPGACYGDRESWRSRLRRLLRRMVLGFGLSRRIL